MEEVGLVALFLPDPVLQTGSESRTRHGKGFVVVVTSAAAAAGTGTRPILSSSRVFLMTVITITLSTSGCVTGTGINNRDRGFESVDGCSRLNVRC